MKPGICGCCKTGSDCKFRQPGTWVAECDQFEQRPAPLPAGLLLPGPHELDGRLADQPAMTSRP